MLGSTTRAGLTPRLFTPKLTSLPRTPYFPGVFAGRNACKGIWIGRTVHVGLRHSAAAALWTEPQQQINITLRNVGGVLQSALTCRRPCRISGAGEAAAHFGNLGTSEVWA